jgi:hypothetical protein
VDLIFPMNFHSIREGIDAGHLTNLCRVCKVFKKPWRRSPRGCAARRSRDSMHNDQIKIAMCESGEKYCKRPRGAKKIHAVVAIGIMAAGSR